MPGMPKTVMQMQLLLIMIRLTLAPNKFGDIMVCAVPYSYQKCNHLCSRAKLMMEKYKIGAEEAWVYLEEHKFDVDKTLIIIEGRCQVSTLYPKTRQVYYTNNIAPLCKQLD